MALLQNTLKTTLFLLKARPSLHHIKNIAGCEISTPVLSVSFSHDGKYLASASTDKDPDALSLVSPDRSGEGLSGPGLRLTDDQPTNTLDRASPQFRPTNYERARQNQPVDGVDFFQYKKKF